MKSSIFGLLFFSNIASGLTSVVLLDYKMIRSGATWNDAQTFCKKQFTGLATLYNQSNLTSLYRWRYFAWIDPSGVDKGLWMGGTPQTIDTSNCAAVHYVDRKVSTQPCDMKLFVICQNIGATAYKFIPEAMSWIQAQAYCLSQGYGQLVKLGMKNVNSSVQQQNYPIWIGLQKDSLGTWSYMPGYSLYTPWANGEPSANGNCASVHAVTMDLGSQDCGISLPFICINENVFLVKENKSWEEALQYCRGLTSSTNSRLHFDLLSVEPGQEQDYVMNKVLEASNMEAWIGLRFLAGGWLWVNGADVLYADLPVCPLPTQHCGALAIKYPGTVVAKDCIERKNFLCYSY